MSTSTAEKPPYEGTTEIPKALSVKDDRSMATISHFGGVLGCIPSAIIYATMRHRGRFTAQESREALNFTLLPSLVILLSIPLAPLPFIGWFFGMIAALCWVWLAVMSLMAGIVVNRGNPYQYRFNTALFDRLVQRRRAKR